MRDHVYQYDRIVYGLTLESCLYAYYFGLPVFYTVRNEPFPFEFLDLGTNLNNSFGRTFLSRFALDTPDGVIQVGASKKLVMNHFVLVLSLSGLLPTTRGANSVRFVEDNLLSIKTSETTAIRVKFNQIVVFDETGLDCLPTIIIREQNKYIVADWYNLLQGGNPNLCPYSAIFAEDRKEEFVNAVYFYINARTQCPNKDLVSVSFLTEKELNMFNFQQNFVMKKTRERMKKVGLNGGKRIVVDGVQKYHSIWMKPTKREIRRFVRDQYESTDIVQHNYQTAEEIYSENSYRKFTIFSYIFGLYGRLFHCLCDPKLAKKYVKIS